MVARFREKLRVAIPTNANRDAAAKVNTAPVLSENSDHAIGWNKRREEHAIERIETGSLDERWLRKFDGPPVESAAACCIGSETAPWIEPHDRIQGRRIDSSATLGHADILEDSIGYPKVVKAKLGKNSEFRSDVYTSAGKNLESCIQPALGGFNRRGESSANAECETVSVLGHRQRCPD